MIVVGVLLVPAIDDDGLVLFESGAIVLHIGERCETLLPADKRQRARAITWSFAALNSIEPPLQELGLLNFLWANEVWAIQRRPILEAFVNQRLNDLSASLGNREYLEDRFTAADLLMTTVLRIPRQQPIVQQYGNLFAYKERCEARPAFQRAQGLDAGFRTQRSADGLIRVAQGKSPMKAHAAGPAFQVSDLESQLVITNCSIPDCDANCFPPIDRHHQIASRGY